MERLTNTGTNGEIWITDNDETRKIGQKEAAYKKLKAYEDSEEQGRLIKPPCTVGDIVYEYKYKKGFSDGAKAVCGLILETLKDQRFDILDSSNNEIALQTINTSIKSVQDRLDEYNNNTKLKELRGEENV